MGSADNFDAALLHDWYVLLPRTLESHPFELNHFSCSCTACTLRNFERTINKDLKDNFPGLDSWLDEALKYWDPHYDRAVDEGE